MQEGRSSLAEGAGECRRKAKARLYRIARRSATECVAIMDILRRLPVAASDDLKRAERSLFEIVSMLTGLVTSLDAYRW